jgi:hypothetical protein
VTVVGDEVIDAPAANPSRVMKRKMKPIRAE